MTKHSPELQSQVRLLAWQLAMGEISREDYRAARREKVKAITSGSESLYYETLVLHDASAAEYPEAPTETFVDHNEPRSGRAPAQTAIMLLIVVAMGAGWFYWQASKPPVVATVPVVEMTEAEKLLNQHVGAGDWSVDGVSALQQAWLTLSPADQAAARQTVSWRRLQNQLRERINEQRVLASVDDSGEAETLLQSMDGLQRALGQR